MRAQQALEALPFGAGHFREGFAEPEGGKGCASPSYPSFALTQESIFIVPKKSFAIWPVNFSTRKLQDFPVQLPILIAVVENLFDFITHNKSEGRIYCRVACVKDTMNILSE